MRKFYGIGVGPGDSELMTLKAVRLIEEADYIFIPRSKGQSTAKQIAAVYIKDKPVIELDFPMGEDNSERYKSAAELVDSTIADGETGVFLTLGDPMTYSTYIYLLNQLKQTEIELETVPGISSFTASASRLNLPLAIKGESIYIVDGTIDPEILKRVETVCILKANQAKGDIIQTLEAHGFEYSYIRRVSQETETILTDKAEILAQDDYMAMIFGRTKHKSLKT